MVLKDLKSLKARRQDVKNGAAVSQDVDDSESKAGRKVGTRGRTI